MSMAQMGSVNILRLEICSEDDSKDICDTKNCFKQRSWLMRTFLIQRLFSSHVHHSLEPRDYCQREMFVIPVQRDMGESSFSAGVPFSSLINYKEPIPHSDTLSASSKVQHDQGESSFSAGSISLRSDSSATSTRLICLPQYIHLKPFWQSSF
ncbi:hypothetical protein M0R45_022071 [Rubus argutus]|uniref:Uncharacterized protein n=1 Tax=Rubus argutus TaxID=59490 RepID=A0AAW1XGT0_RUBAR